MKEKFSISYFFANEEIRNLIFEEWEKINILLNNGPQLIKEYFYKMWNEIKFELEITDDEEIADLDENIKIDDFTITYSILKNEMKIFNFIMPKTEKEAKQVVCCSLLLTGKIPRYFVLEKDSVNEIYTIGEWKMDFENNDYIYKTYETIENFDVGELLRKIINIVE